MVIAVVDGPRSGVIALGKLDDGATPDGDTVYEIGSITKTMTATLLADAVLSNQMTLETPLASLLPGFTFSDRQLQAITVGQLAEQRSGLPRLPSNLQPKADDNPYADYDADQLKSFLAGYTLPRQAGAAYDYSNLGFGVLGFALAQQARTPYGLLLSDKLFKPLGMTHSGTGTTTAMRGHLATGHDEAGQAVANWTFDALAGAGAVRSTGQDMLRYLQANMGQRTSALAAAMALAHTPRADINGRSRIGLAWMTLDQGVVWHNGGTGGYRSFIGWTADRQRGVVVLANAANSVGDLGLAILVPASPLAPVPTVIALKPETLDDYLGSCELAPHMALTVSRSDNQLFAQATGQSAFALYPSAPDAFFAKVAGISLSFQRNTQGQVNGLVLHQHGDHAAPKVDSPPPAAPTAPAAMTAATLADFRGRYRFDFGAELDVTDTDGQLSAQLTGQQRFPVFPQAQDHFACRAVDAQLSFERDAAGHAVAVTLHQNGQLQRAPRVSP